METRTRYGTLSGSGMQQLILVGGLALIAYFIVSSLAKKGAQVAQAATGAVVNPLADFYAYLTAQGATVPQGVVLMPNGDAVPVAILNVRSVPNTNSATFQYQGGTYYINGPHDANGNWAASTTLGA